jgi:membrane protein implicated in regulation of membrane protease activity
MAAYLIWFLVGLAFILLELASPLFISIFFGLGCWITALAEGLIGLSFTAQFAVFAVSTVLCLAFLRRYAKRLLPAKDEREGEDE